MSEPTSDWGRGAWMQTFTGRRFYPLDPRPEDIEPTDIAHALSLICRYGGHTIRFYSVAEHCVLMSQAVSPENALWALLHDATEAYVGDMVRPLKRHMPAYRDVEDRLMLVLAERFGLPIVDGGDLMPAEVKAADNRILLDERAALLSVAPADWAVEGLQPLGVRIKAWSPEWAEFAYADRLEELLAARSTRSGAGGPVADLGTPSSSEITQFGEPRIGELFAGYGGLGLGVQEALGGEVAWYSDVCKFHKDGTVGHSDPHRGACKIMAHRFPGVPNLGDVAAVDWSTVEPVDILTGGSPCQDVSGAGARAGMTEGTRSNLWVAMREAIAQLRPGLVVWENVGGVFSAKADSNVEPCPGCAGAGRDVPSLRALARVLGDLATLGFDAEWCALPASGVGGCHGRLRVFVGAWPAADAERGGRERWARAARRRALGGVAAHRGPEGTLLPTPGAYDAERGGPQHPDKRRAGGHSVSLNDALHGLALLPTPAVNDMGEGKTVEWWDDWTEKLKAEHGNGNGHGKSLAIELQRVESGWGPYTATVERWGRVIGREAPPPSDGVKVREWMMGLSDGWVTDVPGITRNEATKALGNGVVPQQCAAAVREMFSWEAAV